MNTTKNLKLIICSLAIFLFGVTACNHRGGLHHSDIEKNEIRKGHIVSKLDLDGNQEAMLNEIMRDMDETRKDLAGWDELRQIFVSQLKNEDLDEEYLRLETAKVIRELENTSDKLITGIGSFHASLDADQRGKLSDFFSRKMGKRRHHS